MDDEGNRGLEDGEAFDNDEQPILPFGTTDFQINFDGINPMLMLRPDLIEPLLRQQNIFNINNPISTSVSDWQRVPEDNPDTILASIPSQSHKTSSIFRTLSDLETQLSSSESISLVGIYSTTCDDPSQSIQNTLNYTRSPLSQRSFWSSAGYSDANSSERLVFRSNSLIKSLHGIVIQLYRAFYQLGAPIYPAERVRFGLGWSPDSLIWTKFSKMYKVSELQLFDVEEELFRVNGKYLVIEFDGFIQKQRDDGLYYLAVESVRAFGVNGSFRDVLVEDLQDSSDSESP